VSVPDPSIRALYARLEEVLGAEHADTLMTRLPPPPDELARKADVDRQFEAVGVRFDNLEQRFDGLEERFDRLEHRVDRIEDRFDRVDQNMHHMFEMMQKQLKTNTTMMVTSMTALTAIYGGMLVAFVA
jgi:predicted nuclease with TOPRIM domain